MIFFKDSQDNNRLLAFESTQVFSIFLLLIAIIVIVIGYSNQHTALSLSNILRDFYANVSSELISIVITVLVLDRLSSKRQEKQELLRLKAFMGSDEVVITRLAVSELALNGWLRDGSLKGVILGSANLEGARLWGANLQQAELWSANLSNSNLERANLQEVDLSNANLSKASLQDVNLENANIKKATLEMAFIAFANLKKADLQSSNLKGVILAGSQLQYANLENVDLQCANLQGANLAYTNLLGADLRGVSLLGANLQNAQCTNVFLKTPVILPDGTTWSKDINIKRFTDEKDPEYKSTLEKINKIRKSKGFDEVNFISVNRHQFTESNTNVWTI